MTMAISTDFPRFAGKTFADGRDAEARFGKRHADVLGKVRDLNCSGDFRLRNFAEFASSCRSPAGESVHGLFMFVVLQPEREGRTVSR
jgi:hypothetical protein